LIVNPASSKRPSGSLMAASNEAGRSVAEQPDRLPHQIHVVHPDDIAVRAEHARIDEIEARGVPRAVDQRRLVALADVLFSEHDAHALPIIQLPERVDRFCVTADAADAWALA
jgi:hypothetical protein